MVYEIPVGLAKVPTLLGGHAKRQIRMKDFVLGEIQAQVHHSGTFLGYVVCMHPKLLGD
jgi:hypothetical protein